jgi:hypothetical protein
VMVPLAGQSEEKRPPGHPSMPSFAGPGTAQPS